MTAENPDDAAVGGAAMAPVQCVILGGGLGLTGRSDRLADDLAGPALAELLFHARRFGFREFLAIASADCADALPADLDRLVVAPTVGIAGALRAAAGRLDETFVLLDAGTLFDINWLDLVTVATPERAVALALRARDGGPYRIDAAGTVFAAGSGDCEWGGIAWAVRDRLLRAAEAAPGDIWAAPMARGEVAGRRYAGPFVDIRADGAAAARQLRRRPALFLDRDGVLNVDHGYVHDLAQLDWIDGAIAAVKLANDLGHYVFLVTNQAGVARGFYDEATVQNFHGEIQAILRRNGAHLDDIRYCPFHPEGKIARYARASDWRKPNPGMLLDLLQHWPVDIGRSLMVGDKLDDMTAAERAGIRGLRFTGGNLDEQLAIALRDD